MLVMHDVHFHSVLLALCLRPFHGLLSRADMLASCAAVHAIAFAPQSSSLMVFVVAQAGYEHVFQQHVPLMGQPVPVGGGVNALVDTAATIDLYLQDILFCLVSMVYIEQLFMQL